MLYVHHYFIPRARKCTRFPECCRRCVTAERASTSIRSRDRHTRGSGGRSTPLTLDAPPGGVRIFRPSLSLSRARARAGASRRCVRIRVRLSRRVHVCMCARVRTCARALSEGARQPEERNSLVNCWLYPFYLYFPHSKRDEYIRAPPLPPRKRERKGEKI